MCRHVTMRENRRPWLPLALLLCVTFGIMLCSLHARVLTILHSANSMVLHTGLASSQARSSAPWHTLISRLHTICVHFDISISALSAC